MRILAFLRNTFLIFAIATPFLVRAQFQAPTEEELKMTADSKYPDAAAIYLYRESRTDDTVHFQSEHVRIKVLKEAGKELATVNLGYFKGNDAIKAISARTIHADGTIIPLSAKPEDLMQAKQGNAEIRQVTFNLPSVEVGSILEYYYQVRYDEHSCQTPQWEIQGRYPVRKARFFYEPCPGMVDSQAGFSSMGIVDRRGAPLTDLMWYARLPGGKPLAPNAVHRFELNLADIPPLPKESWMPPADSQRYQVRFYFSPGSSGAAYWQNESGHWIAEVNRFAEPTSAIKAAAAGIVAAGDSDIDKAKKLYAAVQALDNTDFTRQKSAVELKREGFRPAKHAGDTWNQKSGRGEDIALLYLALLRGAGLTAYPMKLVNRGRAVFDPSFLQFDELDDLVIVLSTGGKEIVLDPAEKMCPFQMVHWHHSGAGGVRQGDKTSGPWITPLLAYNANTVTRIAELTVNPQGGIKGNLQISFAGQEALEWRQSALRQDEAGLKRDFEAWLSHQVPNGVEVHLVKFANLDDPNSDLTAFASASGTPGSATAKRLMLPGSFFANPEERTFVEQPNRQLPVDMHYAAQVKDGVMYHLPPEFAVESLPPPTSIPWPNHAILQTKSMANGSDVTLTSTLGRAFTILGADEYGKLRDFYQKVAAANQQQLVLTASPAVKGN